jgi:hypothetical protein
MEEPPVNPVQAGSFSRDHHEAFPRLRDAVTTRRPGTVALDVRFVLPSSMYQLDTSDGSLDATATGTSERG